jgi:hypothetical protein
VTVFDLLCAKGALRWAACRPSPVPDDPQGIDSMKLTLAAFTGAVKALQT